MKLKVSLAIIFTLLFSFAAQADLLIEPAVGFNLGTKFSFEGGSDYTGGKGASYGGRLGYQNLGLQLGLDYLKSSIDMNDSALDKNVDTSEWGAFAGFKFPVLLRVYAGYIFSATGTTKSSGTDVELNKGSGYKAGIGFTGLPFVNINLEYRAGSFSEWKSGTTTNEKSVDYSSIMLGLSLPFTI
ncbi:MAG: porin family protein [Bacteriovoracaceae bacterium]|nr:porin family protein [Bacteriovoracaceae bacterium]